MPNGKKAPYGGFKAMGKAKGNGKGKKGPRAKAQGQQQAPKKKQQRAPMKKIGLPSGVTFRLPTSQPIPTLFADGKWVALGGSFTRTYSCPLQSTTDLTQKVRQILVIANDGVSSNCLYDFGNCISGSVTAAGANYTGVSIFPATSSGLTSSKSGRNGFGITLQSPPGMSVGSVYIYKNSSREYLNTVTPTQDQMYQLSDSIIQQLECRRFSEAYFATPRAFFNTPRSAMTYAEFNPWLGTLSAADFLRSFTSQAVNRPFPMTATWVILEMAIVPSTNSSIVPANFNISTMLQLGTRWDSDNPMSTAQRDHPTIDLGAFNSGTR